MFTAHIFSHNFSQKEPTTKVTKLHIKFFVIRLVHSLVKLYAFQHFMTTYFLLRTWPIHVLRFHSKPFQSRLSQLCALYHLYRFI